MHGPKLALGREIAKPTPLAVQTPGAGALGGTVEIAIENCDSRIVMVPYVWVERATDKQGPTGVGASIGAGVTWSVYSARRDSKGDPRPMRALDNCKEREVRPSDAWGSDGILSSGDNLELSSCGPLVVVVNMADIAAMPEACQQTVYFALDAYPSDALAEFDGGERRQIFEGILQRLKVTPPVSPLKVRS